MDLSVSRSSHLCEVRYDDVFIGSYFDVDAGDVTTFFIVEKLMECMPSRVRPMRDSYMDPVSS